MQYRLTAFLGLALAATIGLHATVQAAFTDTAKSPYQQAIDALKSSGIVAGYADGSFKPAQTINRAEFLKIVIGSRFSAEEIDDCPLHGDFSNVYTDVAGDEWFVKYLCLARLKNIVSGYPDGSFKPGQEINFAEAAKILSLAYGQEPGSGNDWYQGYVEALGDSRAIPTSVQGFAQNLQRGEMAEMMWRLKDGITDKASTSFTNIKYPEARVDFSSNQAQIATSCMDVAAALQAGSANNGNVYMRRDFFMDEEAMPALAGAPMEGGFTGGTTGGDRAAQGAMAPTASKSTADGDYSTTNIQVQGVDEADIVKTDGTFLYTVRNGKLYVAKAVPAESMKVTASIDFTAEGFSPQELYLDDSGRLIVIGSRWENGGGRVMPMMEDAKMMIYPPWGGGTNRTEVRIYAVSKEGTLEKKRTLNFDGNQISSRKIGGKLYLVMNQQPNWGYYPMPLLKSADVAAAMPSFSDSAVSSGTEQRVDCAKATILPRSPNPSLMIIATIPVTSDSAKADVQTIVGNGDNVYASTESLYVAATNWNYAWNGNGGSSSQTTTAYRFDITDSGVKFASQGSVPGRILNQFSMDEHNGFFRIATTKDGEWNNVTQKQSASENNLYILDEDGKTVGSIEGIAPGESIYSVRFMGNRGYMVTFKQVDPLFVLDLSNPRSPRILGKLKIPGYSDYLHPYDETHLIGFGKEVDETIDADKVHSDNAVYYTAVLGMKLAIFDVSDVEHPREMYKEVIGDRGTESPVLQNHKALLFEKDRGLLAFPVSVQEFPEGTSFKDPNAYPTQTFQGAYVYDISLDKGFELRGKISHYDTQDVLKSGGYLYGKDIDRIVRLGSSLYTLSQEHIQAHGETSVKLQGDLSLTSAPLKTDTGKQVCPDANSSSVTYISGDLDTCATIRFTCDEGKEPFNDKCGCGCKPIQ